MPSWVFNTGDTSKSIDVFLADSSSTIGAGLSGLVFNTSNLKCYYRKNATGTATAITLATQTVGGAWSSGGFVEIDATNEKGVYRFDIPDTVIAAAGYATLYFYGATNLAPAFTNIQVSMPVNIVQILGTAISTPATAGILDVNLKNIANSTVSTSTAQLGVNAVNIGGTAQTGRDIGASVLLSTGTGTGQLDFTSGIVKSNQTQILGTAISTPATAGIIDVNLKNIANATVSTSTAQLGVNVIQAAGTAWASGAITAASIAADAIGASELAADAATEIANAVWALDATGQQTQGSFGQAIGDPAADTDSIWALANTNLDAAVSSRMATYTQPTGFLAATFPSGTVANTTNITAGTIATVTNLTNAPTSGDLTSTMKTSVTTACTASTPTAAAVTGAVGSVTGNVGGNVTGSIGSLASQAKADVNAEALDVLNVDTYAEPGQGNPSATASLAAKINYLYKAWRNKKTQTATVFSLFADDASTVDHKASVSDDGTTTTSGEVSTGP